MTVPAAGAEKLRRGPGTSRQSGRIRRIEGKRTDALEKVHLYNQCACTIIVEKPKKKG